MSSITPLRASALAATVALGISGWAADAAGGPMSLSDGQVRYAPIQSIHYEIGSKAVSGYFVAKTASCLVTLMVIEKSDPEAPLMQSAARVRLMLSPGQVAGVDSEEGRSLNFTCAEDAMTLIVDVGEREVLVEQQAAQHRELTAQSQTPAATPAATAVAVGKD